LLNLKSAFVCTIYIRKGIELSKKIVFTLIICLIVIHLLILIGIYTFGFSVPQHKGPWRILVCRMIWDPAIGKLRYAIELYDPQKHTPKGAPAIQYEDIHYLYNTSLYSSTAPSFFYSLQFLRQIGLHVIPANDFRPVLAEFLSGKGWSSEQIDQFLYPMMDPKVMLGSLFQGGKAVQWRRNVDGYFPYMPSTNGTLFDIDRKFFSLTSVLKILGGVLFVFWGIVLLFYPSIFSKLKQPYCKYVAYLVLSIGLITEIVSILFAKRLLIKDRFIVAGQIFFQGEYPPSFLKAFADSHGLAFLIAIISTAVVFIGVLIFKL
jgi:hypothetical protein